MGISSERVSDAAAAGPASGLDLRTSRALHHPATEATLSMASP